MPNWNKITKKATIAELSAAQTAVFGAMGAMGLGAFKWAVASWKGAQWTYFGKEPQFLKQFLDASCMDVGKLCALFALINEATKISAQRLFNRPDGLIVTALKFTLVVGTTQWAAKRLALPTSLAIILLTTRVASLLYKIVDLDLGVEEQFNFLIQTFNHRLKELNSFPLSIEKRRPVLYEQLSEQFDNPGRDEKPATDAWREEMRRKYAVPSEGGTGVLSGVPSSAPAPSSAAPPAKPLPVYV